MLVTEAHREPTRPQCEHAREAAFVAALEYATRREAFVVGAAVMVGDDIESDIGGALAAGLRAVLVRTGKYRSDVVAASGIEPTALVDTIAEVPALVGIPG